MTSTMPQYQYFTTFGNRYHSNSAQFNILKVWFDCMTDLRFGKISLQHDVRPFWSEKEATFFSSNSYCGIHNFNNSFNTRSKQFLILPQSISALSYQCSEQISWQHNLLICQKNRLAQLWDSIDNLATPRITTFYLIGEPFIQYKELCYNSFNASSIRPLVKFILKSDFLSYFQTILINRFNTIPADYLSKYLLHWNANKKEFTSLPVAHQSLVRSGWKIIAREITTDKTYELGFIDADNSDRLLSNIFLPNGDYEISVLSSSLFWQDCVERNVRTITIRDDVEVTPLPVIYNLRSSVSQGVTIIQWSANQSEIDDCVFGVWYSNKSPVDTNRPPDATVWYFPTQTEYQTTFYQQEKSFIAIAAMRTGNESELGTIHELLLDWNIIPPRAPDDVVVGDRH